LWTTLSHLVWLSEAHSITLVVHILSDDNFPIGSIGKNIRVNRDLEFRRRELDLGFNGAIFFFGDFNKVPGVMEEWVGALIEAG